MLVFDRAENIKKMYTVEQQEKVSSWSYSVKITEYMETPISSAKVYQKASNMWANTYISKGW